MIEVTAPARGPLVEIRASGRLTDKDYKITLIPRLESLFAERGKLNLLVLIDEAFEGWDLEAAWDDAVFGMRHRADFGKIALVGAPRWLEIGARLGGFLMQGEMRSFPRDQLETARAWTRM
jgi:SpoIIAA-like